MMMMMIISSFIGFLFALFAGSRTSNDHVEKIHLKPAQSSPIPPTPVRPIAVRVETMKGKTEKKKKKGGKGQTITLPAKPSKRNAWRS